MNNQTLTSRSYNLVSSPWMLRDVVPMQDKEQLALYTNDLYKLLIKKLAHFESLAEPTVQEKENLAALFKEFLQVKDTLSR